MANSFYHNDQEDTNAYKKMVVLCIAAASVVMLLFLIVLYTNSQSKRKSAEPEETVEQTGTEEDIEVGKSNLTSEDLEFWDMYADEEEPLPEDEDTNSVSANFTDKKKTEEETEKETMTDIPEDEKLSSDEEMNDGKHISIEDTEGNKIWYEILESVPKNTYQLNQYLSKNGEKLSYSENGKSSMFGIDVSKYQGTIDWELVRESGVQYAMLRVASRGYGSGQLLLDENFVKNAEGANKNGIKVGVYVYSQAVNELEAIEEANFAVAAVSNYKITYPIACDIEEVENDTARTDKLTVEERTKCVKAFCDTVKTYGYKPVIYAERDMLISKLDMEALSGYDVWLADSRGTVDSDLTTGVPNTSGSTNSSSTNNNRTNNSSTNNGSTNNGSTTVIRGSNTGSSSTMNSSTTGGSASQVPVNAAGIMTDYPYQFTMWQYSKAGTINGISGSVDLNICFIDYEEK